MVRQQCQVYHTSQNICPAKKDIKVACVFLSKVPRALREGESGAGPRMGPARRAEGGCAGGARRGSERTLVEGRRGCPRRIQEKGTPSRSQVRGARRRMPFVDGDDGAPCRDLGLGVLGCSSSALIRSVTILVGGERMGGRRRSRWTAELDGVAVRVATRTVVGTGGRAGGGRSRRRRAGGEARGW